MVLLQVGFQQLLIVLSRKGSQRGVILLGRIAANIVIIDIVGGSDDIQRSRRCIAHAGTTTAAISLYLHTTLSSQTTFDTLVFCILNRSRQDAITRIYLVFQWTSEGKTKRQGALLAGCQSYDDGMVGKRGKNGTLILHTFINIRGGIQCRTDVQFATVVRHVFVT